MLTCQGQRLVSGRQVRWSFLPRVCGSQKTQLPERQETGSWIMPMRDKFQFSNISCSERWSWVLASDLIGPHDASRSDPEAEGLLDLCLQFGKVVHSKWIGSDTPALPEAVDRRIMRKRDSLVHFFPMRTCSLTEVCDVLVVVALLLVRS